MFFSALQMKMNMTNMLYYNKSPKAVLVGTVREASTGKLKESFWALPYRVQL